MQITESKGLFSKTDFDAMCTNEKRLMAKSLRSRESQFHQRLWSVLRQSGAGCLLHRRVVVYGYIPAFWCPSLRLAVDITDPAPDRDYLLRRDQWLADRGVTIIRFSKLEALFSTDACLRVVRHHVDRLRGESC